MDHCGDRGTERNTPGELTRRTQAYPGVAAGCGRAEVRFPPWSQVIRAAGTIETGGFGFDCLRQQVGWGKPLMPESDHICNFVRLAAAGPEQASKRFNHSHFSKLPLTNIE
jgi:hypothetical protein